MIYNDGKSGFLTVIMGGMFSEKSGNLIERCKKAKLYQKKEVKVYKPEIDNRYEKNQVVSRMGLRFDSESLPSNLGEGDTMAKVLEECKTAELVAFDECQFFSKEILNLVWELLKQKKHVIVAGLNLDFLGRPFGQMEKLVLYADEVVLKQAYCNQCGRPAVFTQRMLKGKAVVDENADTVEIGDNDHYEARCRLCFER